MSFCRGETEFLEEENSFPSLGVTSESSRPLRRLSCGFDECEYLMSVGDRAGVPHAMPFFVRMILHSLIFLPYRSKVLRKNKLRSTLEAYLGLRTLTGCRRALSDIAFVATFQILHIGVAHIHQFFRRYQSTVIAIVSGINSDGFARIMVVEMEP